MRGMSAAIQLGGKKDTANIAQALWNRTVSNRGDIFAAQEWTWRCVLNARDYMHRVY